MASGLVRSALVVALLLSGTFLLVLYPVCGDNPSYTECRPHIDATIRDLAAKALHAGETPSESLEQLDYASADALASAQPSEAPEGAEEGKAAEEPVPAAEEPPIPEPAPESVTTKEPPPTEPVVPEVPSVPEALPIPVEAPPAPVLAEAPAPQKAEDVLVKAVPEPTKDVPPSKAVPKAKAIGIINKFVDLIFGLPKHERDSKWAQPWQTHKEFQKVEVPEIEKQRPKAPTGSLFDSFIGLIFGKPSGARDAKWAEPWQNHKEHKKAAVPEAPVSKKIEPSGGGVFSKVIGFLFGSPSHPRDQKWAEPWQTHKEHKKPERDAPEEVRKVIVGPTGGIIDKLAKLMFPTLPEGTKRDPKWAQPWQTHAEFARKVEAADAKEVKKAAPVIATGGILDSFVKMIFTVPKDLKRDPKWAQPWQTHPEFARAVKDADEAPQAHKVVVQSTGGIFDKFVKLIFPVSEGTKRDPKWAQPWQTHAEHAKKAVVEAPAKKKKVPTATLR